MDSKLDMDVVENYYYYYDNVFVFKKDEMHRSKNDLFLAFKKRIDEIILNNYYAEGFDYSSGFTEKESLTVVIYDNLLDDSNFYDMSNIHSFFEIFQKENVEEKNGYLATYNFCADIKKQGKGTVKNLIANENFRNFYNIFSSKFKDIFYDGQKAKKMWKGLYLDNPLYKQLFKLYINCGYVDVKIQIKTPSGDITKPHFSMWYDPEKFESINEQMRHQTDFVKLLYYAKNNYIIKSEDLNLINSISKYGILEHSFALSKKLINNNIIIELITIKSNPPLIKFRPSSNPYVVKNSHKIEINDIFYNGELVKNISALNVNGSYVLTLKSSDLLIDNPDPDPCSATAFVDMQWHSHPTICASKYNLVPYRFDFLNINKGQVVIYSLFKPSGNDIYNYIFSYNDNNIDFVFSEDFIFSISIREELFELQKLLRIVKHSEKTIFDQVFSNLKNVFNFYVTNIGLFCGNKDVDVRVFNIPLFQSKINDIIFNRNKFIYYNLIDNVFKNIKDRISENLYIQIKDNTYKLYSEFLSSYQSKNIDNFLKIFLEFIIAFEALSPNNPFLNGPYSSHADNISRVLNTIKSIISSYQNPINILSVDDKFFALFRQLHILLYLFSLTNISALDHEGVYRNILNFFKNSFGIMYKSFIQSLTFNDLEINELIPLLLSSSQSTNMIKLTKLLKEFETAPILNSTIDEYDEKEDLVINVPVNYSTITQYVEYYYNKTDGKYLLAYDNNLLKYYIIYIYNKYGGIDDIPKFDLIYSDNGKITFKFHDKNNYDIILKIIEYINNELESPTIVYNIKPYDNEIVFNIFQDPNNVENDYSQICVRIKNLIPLEKIEEISNKYLDILNP